MRPWFGQIKNMNIAMFSFDAPWMALLFFLPWILKFILNQKPQSTAQRYRQTTLLYPHLDHIKNTFQSQKAKTSPLFKIYRLLLVLLWLSLTLALMQPQKIQIFQEDISKGYDLFLVVDASHSMEALDFHSQGKEVTRMQVVKEVMDNFIQARQKDRLGLIIFGSQPYVLSPLTLDNSAVRYQLSHITPTIAGNGTALGDALGLAITKLRQRPKGSRIIILIADGDNTTGLIPVDGATALAQKEAIRIYTIGVGSSQKDIAIMEQGKRTFRDDLTFHEATLKQISSSTGGIYFRATDSQALSQIYQKIDTLEKTQAQMHQILVPQPLYHYPLKIALGIVLLLGFFPELRWRKIISHV